MTSWCAESVRATATELLPVTNWVLYRRHVTHDWFHLHTLAYLLTTLLLADNVGAAVTKPFVYYCFVS